MREAINKTGFRFYRLKNVFYGILIFGLIFGLTGRKTIKSKIEFYTKFRIIKTKFLKLL